MALSTAPPVETPDSHQLVAHWFAAYQMPLYRYLVRLLGDEERAADILQDTFLRAFTALSTQAPPANAPAWLHRIATNLAYNALRRTNRWRWLPFTGREHGPGFENRVATTQAVQRCLARLRPKEAEVLLLYTVAGFSSVEIAGLTGEEPNAVRVRLFRARTRFSALYAEENAHGMS